MLNSGKLAGKTVFITGASRGIGKAIAIKVAKDGANVVVAAKTVDPHPKLEGTIYTAAKEIESAGGKCLPLQLDIRDESQVQNAINQTVNKFGGLDILVNNASAISLTGTQDTSMKKYDLMHSINTRGTFLVSKYAIEHLKKSSNPHILNLSPPLEMKPRWFKNHVAYTMAKYGMSMCVLGMSAELKDQGIAVNALWPRTAIWTAAMAMLGGGDEAAKSCRKPDIIADAAYAIFLKNSKEYSGQFLIDEEVVQNEGITDLEQYAVAPGHKLLMDFFLPEKFFKEEDLIQIEKANDAATEKSSSGSSEAAKVFESVKELVSEELKKDINALLLFTISGQNWFVDAKTNESIQVGQGSPKAGNPDVTLITDEETFVKMAKGEVKPTSAFMSGKLKIKGNLGVAVKVEKLFGNFKAKL